MIGLVLGAIGLHLGVIRLLPGLASLINLIIVSLLAIALFRSWRAAAGLALLAGYLVGQYSLWPMQTSLAFLTMILLTNIGLQRWLTARSTASLVSAASIGTLIYYGMLALSITLTASIGMTDYDVRWLEFIRTALIQSVVHPLVIFFLWRLITGGTFARADRLGPLF